MSDILKCDYIMDKLFVTENKYPNFYLEKDKDYYLIEIYFQTGDSFNIYEDKDYLEIFYSENEASLFVKMIENHARFYEIKNDNYSKNLKEKKELLKKLKEVMNSEFDSYNETSFVFKGKTYPAVYNGCFERLIKVQYKRVYIENNINKKDLTN